MKKLFCIVLIVASLPAFAKIWRVNNNPGIAADFTTIQSAHNSVSVVNGDTLHIEPSATNYGSLSCTKKLIILGPGYFLSQNINQQQNFTPAVITSFSFAAGSEGSVISGMTIENNSYASSGISTSDISVVRNRFNSYYLRLNSSGTSYSNILIAGNYFASYGVESDQNPNSSLYSNIIITNNYIGYVKLHNQFSGVISNNVIFDWLAVQVSGFTVKNNIFTSSSSYSSNGYVSGANNTIKNNLCSTSNGLPSGNGNQNNVVMTNVFAGSAGNSTDGQYQLKSGSPAAGAGENGIDCGMFAGTMPYVLSGIPAIPSIYSLSVPATSTGNTLPVTISIKSNN